MQEEYLHFIWRMKRLDFNNLRLVNHNQSKVQVIDVGWYNPDAGPDFFNGTVIIDGIRWSGNIEFHVKSSDWYLHKHHLDKAYNNVILHLVYEYDKEVFVSGKSLPTIELKSLLDPMHYKHYKRLITNQDQIPCHNSVMDFKLALLQQIDLCFLHRIERKGLALLDELNGKVENKNALFYHAVLKAIGGRTNRLPMQQLAQLLPYKIIAKEKWNRRRVEALIFGCAGMLNEDISDSYYSELQENWRVLKNKHQLFEMNVKAWKFGGVRPFSFPTLLLAQLAAFFLQTDVKEIDFKNIDSIMGLVHELNASFINSYWETHFRFGKESKKRELYFSTLFKSNLMINGIIPFLVAMKHHENDFTFADRAVEIAEKLPPEQNNVMNYWKEIGFHPKNTLESQGLLELNNEFCTFRKCLSCKVGMAILENEKVSPENSVLF